MLAGSTAPAVGAADTAAFPELNKSQSQQNDYVLLEDELDENSEEFRNLKSTLAQMCVVLLCVPCSFVIVSSSTLPLTSRHPPNPAPI